MSDQSQLPQPQLPQEAVVEKSPSDKTRNAWFWLKGHDQTFVAICVGLFLILVAINWLKLSGWGAVPLEVDRQAARRYDFRIDINNASWVEWAQIEGIGEVTARKIIEDRDRSGPFRGISDVQRVKGIGPKTLERMRPFLRVAEDTDAQSESKPSAVRD
jgi:competence protein ComEA